MVMKMTTKTVSYNKTGIESLPENKPALYEILTANGNLNYAGIAHRGRLPERVAEHLEEIPGSTVRVTFFDSIEEARKAEARKIEKEQPKYNKQGK